MPAALAEVSKRLPSEVSLEKVSKKKNKMLIFRNYENICPRYSTGNKGENRVILILCTLKTCIAMIQ